MRHRPLSWRRGATAVAAVLVLAVCTDPPTAPVVEDIELSVPAETVMFFREPIDVVASPLGHLGIAADVTVDWKSLTPNTLSVASLTPDGYQARISAVGVGTGEIEASAGGIKRTFQVTVLDTVFSVTVTPAAVNLVVGDTISLTADVEGPASALTRVRWTASAATIQMLSSPDSNTVLVQAIAAGSVTVSAKAIADSMKGASAAFSTEQGTLLFQQQPTTVMKGAPIGPAVTVVVANQFGVASHRAANAIALSLQGGSCSTAATLAGLTTRTIASGVAAFTDLTVDRVSAGCRIVATADPLATGATSAAFDVSPRGCAPIPYARGAAVSGIIEASDCPITGPGGTFYTHNYSITVPPNVLMQYWRVAVGAEFSPRIEAYLWPPAGAFRDTAGGTAAAQYYTLAAGTYRFSVTSSSPGVTGVYALSSQVGTTTGDAPPSQGLCYFLSTKTPSPHAIDGLGLGGCSTTFQTIARTQASRSYIFYLPANEGATVRLAVGPFSASDAYLELYDVTTPGTRSLLTFDNNSGLGESGLNAQATVAAGPTNRFIEILAGHLTGVSDPFWISITDR